MKVLGVVFGFMILMLAAAVGSGWWIWNEVHTRITHNQGFEPVSVARGETLEQVLNDLADKKIVAQVLPLKLYMKAYKLNPIVKAGNYYFQSPISPLEVLGQLEKGGDFNRLTVIEGWNRWDIADAMCRIPSLHVAKRQDVLPALNDTSLVRDIDATASSLEGFLFPDTYFIDSNSTPEELVKDMTKRFHEVWSKQLSDKARIAKLSAHDAVTMASIIETEAKLKAERPIIASVIMNRISKGMPLSMDSTVVYASKMAGAWKNDGKVYQSDVDRNSPYNTRKVVGLPPGPVGSPGLSSLEAAVSPAKTNYLYYVRDPARNDGAHNFYDNEKDFAVGVQALRAWEQKQGRH